MMKKKPPAYAVIDHADTRPSSVEVWPDAVPVGLEFAADSVRFTYALQRAMAVFGNPLAAVQWLTTENDLLAGQPMQRVVDSVEGFDEVMAILTGMDTVSDEPEGN
jgi:hypothetical protein